MDKEEENEQVASLLNADWDVIEQMIEDTLQKHMRGFGYFEYFIVNNNEVLVKVYSEDDLPLFTVKMVLAGNKLDVVNVL